jgi:sulfite reductase beta subunit-like hemoprotein
MAHDSPSPVELIKIHSNFLRGTLAEELENEQEAFAKDSVQLIKHHGMYQQDDRDARSVKTPGRCTWSANGTCGSSCGG